MDFCSKSEVNFAIFNFPDLGPRALDGPMGPRAHGPRAQGPGPRAQGPRPTGGRADGRADGKTLKVVKIKKTRSEIPDKKTCLAAPHHFSKAPS